MSKTAEEIAKDVAGDSVITLSHSEEVILARAYLKNLDSLRLADIVLITAPNPLVQWEAMRDYRKSREEPE